MRILHLISSGGMYGAEAVILSLSAELNREEREASLVGVFAHGPRQIPALHDAAMRAGVRSELIPCRGQLDLKVPGTLRKMVQESGADVVHAHGYKADIYSFLAFRGTRRLALVSTCHTWYDNDVAVRVYGAADRWVLRHFDEVVAVSVEVQDRLLKSGADRKKVRLIRNGVDVQQFAAGANGRVYRPLGGSPLRVGLVGRLASEKGVDLFLKAAAKVHSQEHNVDFVIAGDGPDKAALEALLRELGLQQHARLIGRQESMTDFYESLDLLVSASRQEGLPVALLEGMASGLPLIATAVGAVPTMIVDGKNGLLVEAGSPELLSQAILTLLRDATARERYGRAGRERVLAEFSAQRMAADYLSVYQDAASRRSASGATLPQSEL